LYSFFIYYKKELTFSDLLENFNSERGTPTTNLPSGR
jgi:hypothetical protein